MRTHGIALSPRWDSKPAYTLKFSPNRAARHPESRKLSQNATVLMARIRLTFLWPRQYFITSFLLVSNLPKSTVGMLRSALKVSAHPGRNQYLPLGWRLDYIFARQRRHLEYELRFCRIVRARNQKGGG